MAVKEVELKLKVAEAIQDDVNKGIVRVDSSLMNRVKVRPGDIVEIEGDRKTVAIIDRAYPGDIGLNIIRMDGIIRRNAKAGIGDMIKIRKADVKEAKKVIIAPSSKGVMIRASPQIFKQGLLGRALSKGDIVSLGGTKRRRTTMAESPFFEDMFSMLDESLMGFGLGDIKFIVADTNPKGAVVISELTEVVFNPDAAVVEEEKVLEVTYEDVGGLDEEIRKIREMVELPLKHPELFQRLGIEPPKGVLLHGAPGTGKTLLAKAVANETNSSFFLINGPEIMCVGPETPIFTNPSGFKTAKTIFDSAKGRVLRDDKIKIIEFENPVTSYGLDENNELTQVRITHAAKLKAPTYRIALSDGNSINTSKNQPFLVCEDGNLVWKKVSELKKGMFVAKVNSLDLPSESAVFDISNMPNLTDIRGKSVIKSRNLSRSNFIKLPKKTSKELLELTGLLFAEGNISEEKGAVTFCNYNENLRTRYKLLLKRLFGIQKTTSYKDGRVVCYSKTLIKYLEFLGLYSGKKKLELPNFFYKLPKEELAAFIRGYFEGDGTVSVVRIKVSGKSMKYPTPKLYSCSKKFLQQIQPLMSVKLGIHTKLNDHRTPKSMMYELVVVGNKGRKDFLKTIGAVTPEKKEKLSLIKSFKYEKEFRHLPFPSLLVSKIREKIPYAAYRNNDWYVYGKGDFTKHALDKIYAIAGSHKIIDNELRKEYELLTRQDIGWERIESLDYVGETELHDFTVDKDNFVGPNMLLLHNSKYYGQSEENLRKIFEDAEKNAPSIIFIDEVDAIAPKREEMRGDVERRVVAQLLALMDGLKSRGKVVVIAATNIPNSLDPALRRPGRFDREIEIAVPNVIGRENVLKIHTRNMPLSKDVDLKELALITHGFVGADLSALSKEAAMVLLRKILPDLKLNEEESIPKELLEKLIIAQKDFLEALKFVRPSAMREVLVEKPNVKWTDVGGLEEVKQELTEAVEWPLKNPESFRRLGIKPPKGILLYGAPGTGKTMLAKAVATETESNFILVKGPELLSKWLGESEKAVRDIFKKARQVSPTVICFDEIDALASKRGGHADSRVTESVVNQMLTEMDGLEELTNVVVIATTNRPDIIDSALLRPGRFDRLVLTPIPDEKMRVKIFEVHTKNMPIDVAKEDVKEIEKEFKNKKIDISIISKMAADEPVSEADLKRKREKITDFSDLTDVQKFLYYLAKKTEGYAGGDIEAVCREAAIFALREDMESAKVAKKHFEKALEKVRPSVTKEIEQAYNKIQDTLRVKASSEIKEKPNYFG